MTPTSPELRHSQRDTVIFAVLAFAAAVTMLFVARPIYWGLTEIVDGRLRSDVLWHNQLMLDSRDGGPNLGYTLYYPLIEFLAAGDFSPSHLRVVAVNLLSTLQVFKFLGAYLVVWRLTRRPVTSLVVSAATFLLVPLDFDQTPQLYMGKFSGSIWHNSTTVLLMPLALGAFMLTAHVLTRTRQSLLSIGSLAAFLIASAAAKPNFAIALIPAAGILCLTILFQAAKDERSRVFTRLLARYVSILACTALVLIPVYVGISSNGGAQGASLGIMPFAVWDLLTDHKVLALLESLALPAVAIVIFKGLGRNRLLQLAWLTVGFAIIEFIVFAEISPSGEPLGHANWIWGAHTSMFVLHVITAGHAIRNWREAHWIGIAVIAALTVVQVILGIVYLTHLQSGPYTYT